MKKAFQIERILVVENDLEERSRIGHRLETLCLDFECAGNVPEAIGALRRSSFDLILSRSEVPDAADLDLLVQLGHIAPTIPIIVLSRTESDTAPQNNPGVWETIQSPVDLAQLESAISRVSTSVFFQQRIKALEDQLSDSLAPPPIVGSSEGMIRLLEGLEDAAFSDRPTLLIGEAGTHRESIARALHDLSPQRSGAFVTLPCESQNFSSAPSTTLGLSGSGFIDSLAAATRVASNGTLFLGGIESLSLEQQSEVFQILEVKEAAYSLDDSDCTLPRLVASANTDLGKAVEAGLFLKELNDRFEGNRVAVPPLRHRREDIAILADHWCRVFSHTHARPLLGVNDQAMGHLTAHSWPGNLRELEAVMRLAVSRSESDRITAIDLPLDLFDSSNGDDADSSARNFDLKTSRQRAETQTIRRALLATKGNRTHAAKLLNISHRALLYKLKAYEI